MVLFANILNTPKLKTLIPLRKRLGSEIVVEQLIVVIAKSHQTSGAENHWFFETWRSCNAKSSQCECSTKPGERTRNGVVSFWKCTFFCVVLWAPDFETKEGIAVYHNAWGQLSVLLDGTKKVVWKGNRNKWLSAPQPVDADVSTSTSWPDQWQTQNQNEKISKKIRKAALGSFYSWRRLS